MLQCVAPAVYNDANELAVAAFLDGRFRFSCDPLVVEHLCKASET